MSRVHPQGSPEGGLPPDLVEALGRSIEDLRESVDSLKSTMNDLKKSIDQLSQQIEAQRPVAG